MRVLVVEDAEDIAELLRYILTGAGYEADVFGDGAKAVEHARTNEPQLVILDMSLPGIDGPATCERLREFSEACIVMLSGQTGVRDRERAAAAGADAYLTKPFLPSELLAELEAVLEKRDGPPDT